MPSPCALAGPPARTPGSGRDAASEGAPVATGEWSLLPGLGSGGGGRTAKTACRPSPGRCGCAAAIGPRPGRHRVFCRQEPPPARPRPVSAWKGLETPARAVAAAGSARVCGAWRGVPRRCPAGLSGAARPGSHRHSSRLPPQVLRGPRCPLTSTRSAGPRLAGSRSARSWPR